MAVIAESFFPTSDFQSFSVSEHVQEMRKPKEKMYRSMFFTDGLPMSVEYNLPDSFAILYLLGEG